jgi:hypothetical protein
MIKVKINFFNTENENSKDFEFEITEEAFKNMLRYSKENSLTYEFSQHIKMYSYDLNKILNELD